MSDGQQRRDERAPHRLPVELEVAGNKVAAVSRNVSVSGMFIETDVALKMGERVRLSFTVPAQREPILTDAEVRWTDPGGAGVRFIGLRARDTWALGRLVGGK